MGDSLLTNHNSSLHSLQRGSANAKGKGIIIMPASPCQAASDAKAVIQEDQQLEPAGVFSLVFRIVYIN